MARFSLRSRGAPPQYGFDYLENFLKTKRHNLKAAGVKKRRLNSRHSSRAASTKSIKGYVVQKTTTVAKTMRSGVNGRKTKVKTMAYPALSRHCSMRAKTRKKTTKQTTAAQKVAAPKIAVPIADEQSNMVQLDSKRLDELWQKVKQNMIKDMDVDLKTLIAQKAAIPPTSQYQVTNKKLGSGKFGTVFAGIHCQTSRKVAVKVYSKSEIKRGKHWEILKGEVTMLQAIEHPGIIRFENFMEIKDQYLLIIEKMHTDMMEAVTLRKSIPECMSKFLIMQILIALQYLHSKGIAHCDLKPENVLLSDGSEFPQAKLCDFGYSCYIADSCFKKKIIGTMLYVAPEVLAGKRYNKSVDIWSIGVTTYVSVSGFFPFAQKEKITEEILSHVALFPVDYWKDTSIEAIDFIKRLLKINPTERPSIEECVAHSWFRTKELYRDLEALEKRLGTGRYITSKLD
ncbi:protein kinase domain-containing protein [Ditylenchus destructor]|uniref:Protein kinase domain-containing protein n=1 Tax=Ditylenchus destructor TaxID=166010 RepID=A0AAD4NEK0_9BILA|nr:protein kinase domain-containing protein [Ditylenchus destructor]